MAKAARERDAAPTSLEVHLLGPFRVLVGGREVEERHWPRRRKPKLLVKLLALQQHHQLHREQAMELLWPDSDPEPAANNLHKTIHLARRALEPELSSPANSRFILTQGQQIILSAPDELRVDVEAFERAAAAPASMASNSSKNCSRSSSPMLLWPRGYESGLTHRRRRAPFYTRLGNHLTIIIPL